MSIFYIDPRLEEMSTFALNLNLCQLRLYNNAAFPWVLLVPNTRATEIVDLSTVDQQTLMKEICLASMIVRQLYVPKKLNIESLGNIVPQIHIHIIARYETDGAWPRSVLFSGIESPYAPDEKEKQVQRIKAVFNELKAY